MAPSTNSDSIASSDDLSFSIIPRPRLLLSNIQIYNQFNQNSNRLAQYFNGDSPSKLSPDQSISISSMSSSEKSSKKKTNVHFSVPSTQTGQGHKKYSMYHISKEETRELIFEYDQIVRPVEYRQARAAVILSQEKQKKKLSITPTLEEVLKSELTWEGTVERKQVYKLGKRQNANREWRNLYAVLKGNQLFFYKDDNYRLHDWPYHNEAPLNINSECTITETSSKKRKYLVRIHLPDNSEYLIRLNSIAEWAHWLAELNTARERSSAATSTTSPGSTLASTPLLKSPMSSAPSTPALPKSPISIITVKDSNFNGPLIPSSPTANQSSTMTINGILERPYMPLDILMSEHGSQDTSNDNLNFSFIEQDQDFEDSYL